MFAASQEATMALQAIMGQIAKQQNVDSGVLVDLEKATKSLTNILKQAKGLAAK